MGWPWGDQPKLLPSCMQDTERHGEPSSRLVCSPRTNRFPRSDTVSCLLACSKTRTGVTVPETGSLPDTPKSIQPELHASPISSKGPRSRAACPGPPRGPSTAHGDGSRPRRPARAPRSSLLIAQERLSRLIREPRPQTSCHSSGRPASPMSLCGGAEEQRIEPNA
jgi:hypothetical protein